jgi:hypothetical protein
VTVHVKYANYFISNTLEGEEEYSSPFFVEAVWVTERVLEVYYK